MKIKVVPVGDYEANCYILMDEASKDIVVIDPGDEANIIIHEIENFNGTLKYVLLTHGHSDHTGAVTEVAKHFKVPAFISEDDKKLIDKTSFMFGKLQDDETIIENIEEKENFKIGNIDISYIKTPGHSPGGICFLVENKLFSGDTLFAGSIGRTDFEGGDFDTIINSIKENLFVLAETTLVYPGHGPSSTIKQEKTYNPFFNMY